MSLLSLLWEPSVLFFLVLMSALSWAGDSSDPSLVGHLASGFLVVVGVWVSFSDGATLGHRLSQDQCLRQKLLYAPISVEDLLNGQALAAGIKGLIAATAVMILAIPWGAEWSPYAPWALITMFLATWASGLVGFLSGWESRRFATVWFIQSFGLMPMILLSGAFFSIEDHEILQTISAASPLTHAVVVHREILSGNFSAQFFLGFAILFLSIIIGHRFIQRRVASRLLPH